MTTVTPPADAEVRWLVCRIDKGMFSDELAVTYPAEGEQQQTVFVSDAAVWGRPGQTGKFRVAGVRRDGALFAVLPSSERDLVTVREVDLASWWRVGT